MSGYSKKGIEGKNNIEEVDWSNLSSSIDSEVLPLTPLDDVQLSAQLMRNEMESVQ